MVRDRGTLQFALLVPAFQLLLFGLIDTNVKHVRTVVLDQSRSQQSRELLQEFVNTGYFEIVSYAPSRDALREFARVEWLIAHEELTRIRNEGLIPHPREAGPVE